MRALVLLSLLATPLFALDGVLLLPNGEPASGSQISVVGRSGSVRVGPAGRFSIKPDPPYPATFIAIGPRGEVYPPLYLEAAPGATIELRLTAALQESVTVVSGVTPNIDASPAAALTVAGQEDLDERQPQHLAQAVQGMAGVGKTEESAAAVPVIRGLSGGRTLILVDGARVSTERRAGASAGFINPFSIGSVEVSRGPGSVAYGSDAFGGVIHAVPRDPVPGEPSFRWMIRGSGGGFPLLSAAAETSFDAAGGALLLRLHGRRGDDQTDGAGDETPNSSFEDGGVSARWVRDLASGRLRAALDLSEARGIGRPSVDTDRVRVSYPEEKSYRLTAGFDGAGVGGWSRWELRSFLGQNALVTDRLTVANGALERTDVEAWDASIRLSGYREMAGGALQSGAEFVSRFDLEAESLQETNGLRTSELSIEDASRNGLALFSTWERPVSSGVTAEIGLRGDRIDSKNRGGWFGNRGVESSALSGHASLTWRFLPDWSSTVQLSRGFREPTLSDRFFRGTTARGLITGNPDLDPETSVQYDAALRFSRGGATAAAFAYRYDIEDLIERYRDGGDFFFRNRGEVAITGIELEGSVPLPRALELQMAATWIEGEDPSGTPIDEIPAPNAQATLRWAGATGFAYLRAHTFSSKDNPGPLEMERPGYTTVEASAGWRWRPGLELIVSVENLLDRTRFASPDESAALAPGRTYTIALIGTR